MIRSGKDCRAGLGCDRDTLAATIHCQASHHPEKKMEVIADEMCVSKSYLANAANPDIDTHQFQARLIVPLCRATKDMGVLRLMARQLDHLLVPMPTASISETDIHQRFMTCVNEVGDVSSEMQRSLSDDHTISDDEERRIHQQIDELQTATAALREAITAKAARDRDKKAGKA